MVQTYWLCTTATVQILKWRTNKAEWNVVAVVSELQHVAGSSHRLLSLTDNSTTINFRQDMIWEDSLTWTQKLCVVSLIKMLKSAMASSRVSTNLTQQISRRFQEGFQEKFRTCLHCFSLLCNVPNQLVCPNTNKNMICTTQNRGKDKKLRPVS